MGTALPEGFGDALTTEDSETFLPTFFFLLTLENSRSSFKSYLHFRTTLTNAEKGKRFTEPAVCIPSI
jgi:hypothetical protein